MSDKSLKMHHVQDSSHDGYEVNTACGLDGWRNDGTSQWYQQRGGERMFRAAFDLSSVTCKRCLQAGALEHVHPSPSQGKVGTP